MSKLNKVLATLSIASSDTRDESIKCIILNTLYESKIEINFETLVENISILYDIQLYEPELRQNLKLLSERNEITINQNSYKITENEKSKLETLERNVKSEERKRYLNFKTFIDDSFEGAVTATDVKLLWEVFRQYLYSCFFHYGEKAIEIFHPNNISSNDFQNKEILREAYEKLPSTQLQVIFKKIIDEFPDSATQEDIDFVNDLGQKALSFASLGLEPELAKDQIDFSLVDWTLYLDTNFLFSILNLHINVENDAAKELLKLIFANPDYIKIQFRYSELTLKELKSKKSDFTSLEENLTKAGIQALIESDELDAFSRRYYTELLDHPSDTLHPNQIIDLAEMSLNTQEIKISRNKRQIEHLGENLINVKLQEYARFIDLQNDIRDDFKKNGGKHLRNYYRSDSQLTHDITLREMIINSRDSFKNAKHQTLNDIKYFGVTLDDLLLKFDSYELRKGDIQYPTFFKPSFLLNKLVKILPIKTDNYKRAFIKAVSSRGFNKDPKKSEDIIKIVKYLKGLGIDDKKVILNLITEKLFVEKFKNEAATEEEKQVFVESELNKILSKTHTELSKAEKKIDILEEQTEVDESAKKRLTQEKERASEDAKYLKKTVDMLQKQVKRLEKKTGIDPLQGTLDFGAEVHKKEVDELTAKLEKQTLETKALSDKIKADRKAVFEKQELYKWRRPTWIQLIVSLALLMTSLLYMFYTTDWNYDLVNKKISDWQRNSLFSMLAAFIFLIFNVVILAVLVSKYKNHSNINAYLARRTDPES